LPQKINFKIPCLFQVFPDYFKISEKTDAATFVAFYFCVENFTGSLCNEI